MAQREPKAKTVITVEVIDRRGSKKGHFEISSGNFYYYRKNALSPTLRLTHQGLVALLEKESEYRELDPSKFKLPAPRINGDFCLSIGEREIDDSEVELVSAKVRWNQLDPRRIDDGDYQFDNISVRSRGGKKHPWRVWISVQANLWMLSQYIDKWLTPKLRDGHKDRDVVVSKEEMKTALQAFLKQLDT